MRVKIRQESKVIIEIPRFKGRSAPDMTKYLQDIAQTTIFPKDVDVIQPNHTTQDLYILTKLPPPSPF